MQLRITKGSAARMPHGIRYGGRTLRPGDVFDASDDDLWMVREGMAEVCRSAPPAPPAPPAVEAKPKKRRGRPPKAAEPVGASFGRDDA